MCSTANQPPSQHVYSVLAVLRTSGRAEGVLRRLSMVSSETNSFFCKNPSHNTSSTLLFLFLTVF